MDHFKRLPPDYQAGLYYIHVNNSATYNQVYGNDAGAWFANATQYNALDADGAGRYLLTNSLANLKMGTRNTAGVQAIDNTSTAVFAQANWHLDTAWTLTTGARITREDRKNLGSSVVIDNGNAADLNPVSINGVSLGGFATTAAGELGSNDATQLALADATAKKYFGATSYSALSTNQKKQLAAAKAIRLKQMGVLFNPTEAEPYRATQPTLTLSPSYKFNPDVTGYFSFQHGEKAGISQFFNGESYLVKAEKTNNFELGVKSALLNKTLIFNADLFLSKISDYQQTSQLLDTYTTALNIANGTTSPTTYGSITGNIPKVKVYGLEVDGVYAGIPRTTLRFAGAYNRAVYESFPNAAFPAEEANLASTTTPYKDISGRTLPGAPKYTFNVGADYHQPVFGDKEAHTSVNLAATSGYISDTAMSAYSWIPKNYTVDWSVGVGKLNKSFDVSLLVKNALGNNTPQAQTWTSVTPAVPRSVAVQFTGKL